MSINRVIVSGNLTRDPELRATAGGMQIMSFGVAVNDRRKNAQTGQWEDYANFIDCTMFGNRAEALSRILRKGIKVCVEGKLRYSSWEKDGQKRSKLEVIPDEVEIMSQAQQTAPQQYAQQPMAPQQAAAYMGATVQPAPQSYAPQQYQQAPQPAPAPQAQQMDLYDADIPF